MKPKVKPSTPGEYLRAALEAENPLQIIGVINAYCALLAERAGFKCLYLSGASVANASFGVPDLGLTNLTDVIEEVHNYYITDIATNQSTTED